MGDPIKLDEKEIKEIQELRETNNRLAFDFGRIKIDIINAKARLITLEKLEEDRVASYKGNLKKEEKIIDKLNKKYGKGQVNIMKGVFIPDNSENG